MKALNRDSGTSKYSRGVFVCLRALAVISGLLFGAVFWMRPELTLDSVLWEKTLGSFSIPIFFAIISSLWDR